MSKPNSFIYHILRPYYTVKRWYQNRFVSFVELCAETEHYYISKKLWEQISKDNADSSEYTIFFEKYANLSRFKSNIAYKYRFFVNADLSGIKTADDKEPYTCNLQLSRFGHMGFQCVQPTPIEVLTEFGIADSEFCNEHFGDRVRLGIRRYKVGDLTAYELKTSPIYIGYTGSSSL